MTAKILEFDVGNSAIKWRLRHEGRTNESGRVGCDEGGLIALFERLSPDELRISSVAGEVINSMIAECAGSLSLECRFAEVSSRFGKVINAYADPSRMGVDRWLAIIAAAERCDGDLLIVDIGTAMTIDVLDADRRHLGGYIFPGRRLMTASLLGGTGKIRFDEEVPPNISPGVNTAECVEHASWFSLFATIAMCERHVSAVSSSAPRILITGGDAKALIALAGAEADGWEYVPDLVLDGLSLMCESGGVVS